MDRWNYFGFGITDTGIMEQGEGYHENPSSLLITLKSQIFLIKDSNLQSSGLVAKFSAFKTRQFLCLLFLI